MYKICHLTSVHPRYDHRIFFKECSSLFSAGFDVTLIVADGDGIEDKNGVKIVGVGKTIDSRLSRMTRTVWQLFENALKVDANIYHFHDPELIPVGLFLKIKGKKVIYDVHENLPRQILSKYYIPLRLRSMVSKTANLAEKVAAWALNGIVAATPNIANRFPAHKTVTVQNFPIMGELFIPQPVPYNRRPLDLAYVGGITDIRGAREMVQALDLLPKDLDVHLVLAGNFMSEPLRDDIKNMPGWQKAYYKGFISREKVAKILGQVKLGLLLFHPEPNHIAAQPTKLFEYLSAGLPVVASDFPLWREIIDGAKCGLLVDPLDVKAIAEAIIWLLENPHEAELMGKRGQEAIYQKFNWNTEAEKLIACYNVLIS